MITIIPQLSFITEKHERHVNSAFFLMWYLFVYYNLKKMLSKIISLDGASELCYNQEILNEIISFTDTEDGEGVLFLRYTDDPILDTKVGFSASHFRNPYVESVDEAYKLMQSPDSEDDYFIPKELFWKKGVNLTDSKIYNHHLMPTEYSASTCLPVYDERNGRVIVNPEFGLSAYLITKKDTLLEVIKELVDQSYMYGGADHKKWHLFKAERYHHGDSDSHKEGLQHSERIVCMLNSKHIMSVHDLLQLRLEKEQSITAKREASSFVKSLMSNIDSSTKSDNIQEHDSLSQPISATPHRAEKPKFR